MARKRKRTHRNAKAQKKDRILRAIQYFCAVMCVVFIFILIKTIADDQVSYESQYRTQQLAEKLQNYTAEPQNPTPTQAPTPYAAPTQNTGVIENPITNATATNAPEATPEQNETDLLSQFFGGGATEKPQLTAVPVVNDQNSEADPDDPFSAFFNKSDAETVQTAAPEPTATPVPTPEPTPEPTATPAVPSRVTKYETAPPAMQAKFMTGDFYYANPDFVGFLTAGVDVQEPVPFCRDNNFYLYNNFYGEEDKAGAAFMDGRNMLWPRSQHVVIHGHNMDNGTVFGTLDDMRKVKNLKAYPTVQFDTIYEDGTYVIYAAFNASMNVGDKEYFDLERYDFATEEEFNAFIAEIQERSIFKIPIDVNYEDELLTLVTCSYYQDNGRFILFTRRLRADETVASVTELMQDAVQLSSH